VKNKTMSPMDNTYASLLIERIEVQQNRLVVQLKQDLDNPAEKDHRHPLDQATLQTSAVKPASHLELSAPPDEAGATEHRARPMKAERRSALIRAIGRGRLWLQEIVDGRETIESLAARQHCSTRHINMTISLAFLAPTLITAAIEGRFPRGIGVAALRDAPAEWSQQMRRLGLASTGALDPENR
jgi:hypothetical protein